MVHFDFANGPKMAIAAPTANDAEALFAFFREETNVEWAGREALTNTLWHVFKENTVYQIGTHSSGLQVSSRNYALERGYPIYNVDQFIAEYHEEDDDSQFPDLSELV